MPEIIVVPNGIWSKLGKFWKFLQDRDELPKEVNRIEFSAESAPREELLKGIQARMNEWSNVDADLVFGIPDFLPIKVFDKGRAASRAVCCFCCSKLSLLDQSFKS